MPPTTPPPADRFCDLVMKGGITSGIVYPRAISDLSHHYHFKSIGGTSAGAIAAAITAAAELQRRNNGSRAGFDLLETLPDLLKKEVSPRCSKLLSLFQPQPGTRRLFNALISTLNSGSTRRRIARIVLGFLNAYWPATLLSMGLAEILYLTGQGVLASLLTLLVAIVLTIGVWVWLDLSRRVVANGFGLCSGLGETAQQPALTPWLHDLIQRAAGKTTEDDPLTFGDLWDAGGFPPKWLKVDSPQVRSIDLQMFSTNLSHGRPYIFPLSDPDAKQTRFRSRDRLFFKRDEIARVMPPDVVAFMCKVSHPYTLEPGREGKEPATTDGAGMYELPEPKKFPVLLAARMSLSFPLLFSAVPLYAIDYDPPTARQFARCWFSDGGISSNFPMHLFDSLVPIWPTFGISLEPSIEGRDEVYLPPRYAEGYGERWSRFGDESKPPASRLGGFFGAIVSTMQNWNDNSLARMPGVRDRVARLRLNAREGGMNLNMKPELIDAIANRGEKASKALIERFAMTLSTGAQAPGWDEHRFVRLSILLKMIDARTQDVARALSADCAHATELGALLSKYLAAQDAQGQSVPPPGYETPLTVDLCDAIVTAVQALTALSEGMKTVGPAPFKPVPAPELRVRPPL